jgi:guanylate kinase
MGVVMKNQASKHDFSSSKALGMQMIRLGCDFDENYYAYYSDLETEESEDLLSSIYIGDNRSNMNRAGKLFVLSGPSGVGKTTLSNALFDKLGKNYNLSRVITYTTKAPRLGEKNGIDYHFVSEQEFELKLSQGFFIEYSKVYGHYYGSPRSILSQLKSGKSFLLVVDQNGAYQIKQQYNGAVMFWITPPCAAVLANRLKNRATENNDDIIKRLQIAACELETEQEKQLFDYVVENNLLQQTIDNISQIIKAEILCGSTNC